MKRYQPVLKPTNKSKEKDWFTVNGAISEDKEEAVMLAKQHSSFKNGNAEIAYIKEIEE